MIVTKVYANGGNSVELSISANGELFIKEVILIPADETKKVLSILITEFQEYEARELGKAQLNAKPKYMPKWLYQFMLLLFK